MSTHVFFKHTNHYITIDKICNYVNMSKHRAQLARLTYEIYVVVFELIILIFQCFENALSCSDWNLTNSFVIIILFICRTSTKNGTLYTTRIYNMFSICMVLIFYLN